MPMTTIPENGGGRMAAGGSPVLEPAEFSPSRAQTRSQQKEQPAPMLSLDTLTGKVQSTVPSPQIQTPTQKGPEIEQSSSFHSEYSNLESPNIETGLKVTPESEIVSQSPPTESQRETELKRVAGVSSTETSPSTELINPQNVMAEFPAEQEGQGTEEELQI